MSVLATDHVTHTYGARTALSDVSIEIASGEILAVLGPNGSGKSTLLRILSLLELPTEGDVLVDGRSVPKPARLARRRELALVPQVAYMFRGSVQDNVEYGLRKRGVARADAREKAAATLEWVGLSALAGERASKLSFGQAQLVSLARAVVLDPRVLLIDEPTAALDFCNAAAVERLMQTWARDKKRSVVLVTHDADQAERLADRVTILSEGRAVATGHSSLAAKYREILAATPC